MLIASKMTDQAHLYHRMDLIGDRGPFNRPAADASHLGNRLETIKAMPQTRAKAEAKRLKKALLLDENL